MLKIDYRRWAIRMIDRCHITYKDGEWFYKDRRIDEINSYLYRILATSRDWNWRITSNKLRRLEAEIMLICDAPKEFSENISKGGAEQ